MFLEYAGFVKFMGQIKYILEHLGSDNWILIIIDFMNLQTFK